ncbi:MAG: substrate-binding domain-containing protein, partial [Ruminococcus sp.]|nr:substrate-binding domain-containing protein [Ruminococcus sp.]
MNKLKRKGLSGRLSALALSLSMVAVLPSCGPADQEQFTRTGKVMVIGKANPDDVSFWADVRNGALDAGEELSYEVTFQSAENDNDVDMQKGFINDAIRDNYDVIVIAPNSLTELNEDLDKATAKGIKIININSACEYDKVSCLIASSDGAAASTAVGAAVDIIRNSSNGKLAGAGRIGIVGHTASTADARITVFKNALTNQILNDMQSNSTEAEYIDAPNGERLPTPNTAAQLAVQAASKAGVHSEEITSRAMQAAQEAAAALTEAGVPGYDDWNGSGASGGGADGELITPEEASEKAREAATAAGAPQQAIEAAAQKAYEEAAAAIEKAKAEGKDVPESGGSSDDDEDEVDVSDLITPEEAAEKARESATAAGAPPQAIEAAAQQAY